MLDIRGLSLQAIFFIRLWYPLNYKESIVLAQEVVVAALLCKIGTEEIFVGDQRVILLFIKCYRLQFSELSEYLNG